MGPTLPIHIAGFALALSGLAATATTQTTTRGTALAPTYDATLHVEITVKKAAADVWKQFGGFCSVPTWQKIQCTIATSKDGELGAVRAINGGQVFEVIVARSQFSY